MTDAETKLRKIQKIVDRFLIEEDARDDPYKAIVEINTVLGED